MQFVGRLCFLPLGNTMKIQTSWLKLVCECFCKAVGKPESHAWSIRSHIWLPPHTLGSLGLCILRLKHTWFLPCAVTPQDAALQLQPACMVLLFHWAVMHGDTKRDSTSECLYRFNLGFSLHLILSIADTAKLVFQWSASGILSTLMLVYRWCSFGIVMQTLFFFFFFFHSSLILCERGFN